MTGEDGAIEVISKPDQTKTDLHLERIAYPEYRTDSLSQLTRPSLEIVDFHLIELNAII